MPLGMRGREPAFGVELGVAGDLGLVALEGCSVKGLLTRVAMAKPRGKASRELERRKGGLEEGKRVHELRGCEARGGGGEVAKQQQGPLVGRTGAQLAQQGSRRLGRAQDTGRGRARSSRAAEQHRG